MAQQRFSFRLSRSWDSSPTAKGIRLMSCLVLSVGQAFLILLNPNLGFFGAVAIGLIMLLLSGPALALPFYILVAEPTNALSVINSGFLSRLYLGNILFVLIVVIWLLREAAFQRKAGLVKVEMLIFVPLICLALIGLASIIYSHQFPDPHVTYAFAHSDAPILLVNLVEMVLLISLPLFVVIVPRMVCTLKDAQWMTRVYQGIGLLYTLGTIFAGPLHLSSQEVILGVQRPLVLGLVSSNLGLFNLLFTCLALSQLLYAREGRRLALGVLTVISALAVITSFGREAWLGLIIGVWVIFFLRFKNPVALLLPLIVVPLLLLLFPGIMDFFNPSKVYGFDRVNIWRDAIAIWQHSPYMGVGAGNYQFFDLTYGIEIVGVAHNQFLEVLAEMGVQGLACLILVLIMIGHIALKRFNTAISNTGKTISLAYLGYFAALLVATFFTGSFVPTAAAGGGTAAFVEESYRWLFLGLVLSIPNWDREAISSELPPSLSDKIT